MAVLCAITGSGFWALGRGSAGAQRRVRAGGDRLVVGYRRELVASWAALAGFVAVSFSFALTTLDLASAEGALVALGLVLAVVPLPDLLRAALTRAHLVITDRGVTIESWAHAASVEWDDVVRVDLDESVPTRPGVRIRARVGAPSYRYHRRRTLIPLEPHPRHEDVVIPWFALDEPWALLADGLLGRRATGRPRRPGPVAPDAALLRGCI